MQINLRILFGGFVLCAATAAASITGTARVTRSYPSEMQAQAQLSSPNSSLLGASSLAWQATNGAYRDGLFQGKLARERGAKPHVSFGRWSTGGDRFAFSAGYEEAFGAAAEDIR
jgi:hypothetical protein